MAALFSTLPSACTIHPKPFKVSIGNEKVQELKTLLKLSKLAPPTYEGAQEDRSFGVTTTWMREAKQYWETKFDWYDPESLHLVGTLIKSQAGT